MSKSLCKLIICVLVVILAAGCTAKTYSVRKDRLDQGAEGNAGYLGGTLPPEAKDRAGVKSTRKTYVLEFQTPAARRQEQEAQKLLQEAEEIAERTRRNAEAKERAAERQRQMQQAAAAEAEPAFTEYKIEKYDTLQKISMKFYNTNHKWSKIYEANKDIIKNPNKIKPGLVIRIPNL